MIYLDYASATPLDPEILREFQTIQEITWANPSSTHQAGQQAKGVLESARQRVSDVLNCSPQQITFVSTATEANNQIFLTFLQQDREIITSTIEHSSIEELSKHHPRRHLIKRVPVSPDGVIDPHVVRSMVNEKTGLISLHLAHNEIGVIQPIHEISVILQGSNGDRDTPVFLHVDASQYPSYGTVSPYYHGVDYMTISAHKLYAPRGAALIYSGANAPLEPLLYGGPQEHGRRPGTENVAAIHAFSIALEKAQELQLSETRRLMELRDQLARGLRSIAPHTVNGYYREGDFLKRLANNLHVTFLGIEQEVMILLFDQNNIAVSAGSACVSGSTVTPHSIKTLNAAKAASDQTLSAGAHIRFSLGRFTTAEEIRETLAVTQEIITKTPAYTIS